MLATAFRVIAPARGVWCHWAEFGPRHSLVGAFVALLAADLESDALSSVCTKHAAMSG